MNYGIIQNRRHDKRGAGTSGGGASSLLQDTRLREMAKQLGLDAKDLGHESAQSLWQLLDDMAANDPGAYQKFIQEQLKDGPPTASPSSSSHEGAGEAGSNTSNQFSHDTTAAKNEKTKNKSPMVLLPRYFAPYPGFVVKCAMLHTVKCQQQETKLFLNCCAHEMVDMPKNPNSSKDVPEDTRAVPSTSNLEIPLAVGKLPEVADVVGDVAASTTPQEGRAGKREASSVIESPSELLKQIHLNRNESVTSDPLEREFLIKPANEKPKKGTSASIDILSKPKSAPSSQVAKPKSETNKSKLIEELDPASPSASPAKRLDAVAKKQQQQRAKVRGTAAVVKKGFLLSATAKKKAPLYPTGSSEGHAPSPYVNLLSRSKVVDLSDVERQKQQGEEEKRKLKDEFSFLTTPSRGGAPTTSSSPGSTAEVDCGDFEFEQLCMDADPELKPLQQHAEGNGSDASSDPARQLFGEGFEEISKFLAM